MVGGGQPRAHLATSGFFALRTPLLPFDELLRWSHHLEAPAAVGHTTLHAALDRDRALLRTRLEVALRRPEVREALFLGSPDLEQAIEMWRAARGSGRGPGIDRALVRYFSRMTSRPTPFGLFGGCSVGVLGRTTRLELAGRDRYRRRTRIDLQHLRSLVQALAPCVGVPVTGADALSSVMSQLDASPSTAVAAGKLGAIQAALTQLDANGLGVDLEDYRQIAASLAEVGGPVDLARLFNVDLVKPAPVASLGGAVVDELRRGVALLHRLARPRARPDLDRFRQDFERRYQDREVPLLKAIDEEHGIGFGPAASNAPLVAGLPFPDEGCPDPTWGRREAVLLRKITDLPPGATEVEIGEGDLDEMAEQPANPVTLPGALSVLATVAAGSDEELDGREFQVLFGAAGGPSGAWLLGRFCQADPELHRRVGQHLAAEEREDPQAVWAEIVHLPDGRFANVVQRPVLRSHEITCGGVSGAPPDRQIPVSDLLISVRDGEIVLRSRRLGRRVIPRLTAAHLYATSGCPVYRFLCTLQIASCIGGLTWEWGALAAAPFLPRVRSGRLVLARARWRLSTAELQALGDRSGEDLYRHVDAWRARRRLPSIVSLVDGNGAGLVVDLTNILSLESFVDLVRSRAEAWVEELFPAADQLCARGPEGAFVHEVVVPFVVRSGGPGEEDDPPLPVAATVGPAPAAAQEGAAVRSFPPGSEWLYAKIYAPPPVLDAILLDVVLPVQATMSAEGVTDRWHFLRYGDPDWHLRVRFHGRPAELQGLVLPALQEALAPFLVDGRVWRLQLDTYEREITRYGGSSGVRLAEEVFSIDSDAVLQVLGRLAPGDQGADERWRVAVVAADTMFDDLGLSGPQKQLVLRRGRDFFARQVGAGGAMEANLSQRFRSERGALETWSDAGRSPAGTIPAVLQPLAQRSARLRPLAAELSLLGAAGHLPAAIVADVAMSYVHLCLNRLLTTDHRRHELVVYDFLDRLNRSRLARSANPI